MNLTNILCVENRMKECFVYMLYVVVLTVYTRDKVYPGISRTLILEVFEGPKSLTRE